MTAGNLAVACATNLRHYWVPPIAQMQPTSKDANPPTGVSEDGTRLPALPPTGEPEVIVRSESLQRVMRLAEKVARHPAAVLIVGETGTGKEMMAHIIHNHSLRCNQPLIDVNCAAIPEHLVESELFGYEKGAFSGADAMKPGFFELANKGTLFLDEIGDLDLKIQVNCCAFWTACLITAWAAAKKSPSTCAWWRPPTMIWRTLVRTGKFPQRSLSSPGPIQAGSPAVARTPGRCAGHRRTSAAPALSRITL